MSASDLASPVLANPVELPGLPAPIAHYSHAVIANGQVFVSGLLALDDAGSLIGAGDAGAQADAIFARLGLILQAAGSTYGDVAKLTIFLISLGDRLAVDQARRSAFGAFRPASTLIEVSGLIGDGTLVEIEAIAAVRMPPERMPPDKPE